MSDFTELPIDDGVGKYHVNRFRIAFELPQGSSAGALAGDLIDNFPTYLKSEFATVEVGDRNHDGKRTFRFHGYAKLLGPRYGSRARRLGRAPLARPYHRLHRADAQARVLIAGEDVGVTAESGLLVLVPVIGPAIGLGGALLGGGTAGVHYNRMHFLAGRRSWRISEGSVFGVSGNVIVLETVAAERFSPRPIAR